MRISDKNTQSTSRICYTYTLEKLMTCIIEAMIEQGLSERELARAAQVDVLSVTSVVQTGKTRLDDLRKILDALHIIPSVLPPEYSQSADPRLLDA